MKIANRDARKFVQGERPFQGSNLYAQFHTDGGHVVCRLQLRPPLTAVCADGVWYENVFGEPRE